MKYPSRNNYGTFVKYPDKFLLDSILQKGKPVTQANNPNLLISYNGGKAVVYEIETNSKKYALKCWTEDLGDLKIRYKAIDEHLKKIQLPYFVNFAYQEQGILVDGKKFPIVRMEWVEGINFKNFISTNINNPASIYNFAEKFLDMVKILHQHQISHGDLQHGNIIVRKNTDLCLIDYDSLYVPPLSNETDNIKGLPCYQHPSRSKLHKLSPKVDYFSELVIYLSLLVLSENPKYWQQIEAEERLIFSEQDLSKPNSSKILKELKNLFGTGARLSEVRALKWSDFNDGWISFNKSYSEGIESKATKQMKERRVKLSPELVAFLNKIPRDNGLIFPSITGHHINGNYFCEKIWKPIIHNLGIEYRSPRQTRHGFISEQLKRGSVQDVSQY